MRALCSRKISTSIHALREALAHERIARRTRGGRTPFDEQPDRDLVEHLLLPHERGAALVGECRVRDPPTFVLRADEVLDRDLDLVEEDLVELAVTGDLAQRADLDALRRHRDREHRDPLVRRCVRIGPHRARCPSRRSVAYDDHTF